MKYGGYFTIPPGYKCEVVGSPYIQNGKEVVNVNIWGEVFAVSVDVIKSLEIFVSPEDFMIPDPSIRMNSLTKKWNDQLMIPVTRQPYVLVSISTTKNIIHLFSLKSGRILFLTEEEAENFIEQIDLERHTHRDKHALLLGPLEYSSMGLMAANAELAGFVNG